MRPGEDELVRWREASMDPSALPARAADLVDAARDVPALPPEALARIRADVAGGARRPSRLRGLPLGLRLATLIGAGADVGRDGERRDAAVATIRRRAARPRRQRPAARRARAGRRPSRP